MTTQKKKDLKDQYQVTDLKEYDVVHTRTTAYPSRRVIMGEQWSERIYNKRQVKSTPPSPVEKVSISEVIDTEEEIQFKKSPRRSLKEQLQDKDDFCRYSTSDIQIMSYLLDVPDAVTIQYQEGEDSVSGIQNVSLQVSLPSCQNITDEAVIEAQTSGSKEGQEGQEIGEQIPERSYVGYYEGTIGLFERPVEIFSSKGRNTELMVAPMTWPPSLVYGIIPSKSLEDDKHQQKESEKQSVDEKKDVEVSLAEFTETILGDSVVCVSPVVGSDKRENTNPIGRKRIHDPHSRIYQGKEITGNSFI